MSVRIARFGSFDDATIDEVRDGGRTLVVAGETYTLRRVNARYVRESEHWYGTRIVFGQAVS
jgi:hypothetical protein